MKNKFVVGKWYRIKKPVANVAGWSAQRLNWPETMNTYDGSIMQCRSIFTSGENAFLEPTHVGFNKKWVIGPYDSREDAQTAMLNDAVKVLEPIFKGSKNVAVQYGGSYGARTRDKGAIKGLHQKNVSSSDVDSCIQKASDEVFNIVKDYVGEMISAVTLSSDKEVKQLKQQLNCLKTELKNSKTERSILYTRNDVDRERLNEYSGAITKYLEDMKQRVASDLNMLKGVINKNAGVTESAINANIKDANLIKSVLQETIAVSLESSKMFVDDIAMLDERLEKQKTETKDQLLTQEAEIKDLKAERDYTETYMECLEEDLSTFQDNLIKTVREQDQARNIFEVGGVPYIIHDGKLWTCDPKKKEKLWTTVTPSDVLVSEVKLKADLANIDSKAEEDINNLYAAFHKRQKARNELVTKCDKELDKPKEVVSKKPLMKRAWNAFGGIYGAKWVARAAGVTVSASAGIAAAMYAASLLI